MQWNKIKYLLAVVIGVTVLCAGHVWLSKKVHKIATLNAVIEARALYACGKVGGKSARITRGHVEVLCNDGGTMQVRLGPSLN